MLRASMFTDSAPTMTSLTDTRDQLLAMWHDGMSLSEMAVQMGRTETDVLAMVDAVIAAEADTD
jgi:hypothetical protein